jgi:hypothetical protein
MVKQDSEFSGPVIDLDQELLSAFNKEEMLAFFDFKMTIGVDTVVSGLCKISEPKAHRDRPTYFCLFFVIDVPDNDSRGLIDTRVDKIKWEHVRRYLPDVTDVLSMPSANYTRGTCFKEVEIYVTGDERSLKSYIAEKLFPAIVDVAGLDAGSLVFWADLPEKKGTVDLKSASEKGSKPSFVEILKDFFLT